MGEDAIFIFLWAQIGGGTEKNFSRKEAPLHYLFEAVTSGLPALPS
jgi:hypothetical protein